MLPYLIAGAIGYGIAKLFEEDEAPKYADGGKIKEIDVESIEVSDEIGYFNDLIFNELERDEILEGFVIYYNHRRKEIGLVNVEDDKFELGVGYIWGLELFEEYKGKGFGKKIMEKIFILHPTQYAFRGTSTKKSKGFWLNLGAEFDEFDEYSFILSKDKLNYSDGGSLLLAPNGKPSNLTPEHYKLVREPAFKKWFGDWQNDPENSSKVVDSNGEPVLVFHGTNAKFNIFKIGSLGTYFSDKYEVAKEFGEQGNGFLKIIPVFLKIKKPFIKDYKGDDIGDPSERYDFELSIISNKKYDGSIYKNVYDSVDYETSVSNVFVAFNPNQIKLADGTNTTFDANNPDIRFAGGGKVKKVKFDIEDDDEEQRITISIKNIGEVILVVTYPEYEFLEDIGEDGLEELGVEEGDMIGKIEHLEINDEYKGQGYAKLLMNKAIELAKEKGLMPLYLNASPMGSKRYGLDVDDLTGFYESLGFEVFLRQGGNNLMILKETYDKGGKVDLDEYNRALKEVSSLIPQISHKIIHENNLPHNEETIIKLNKEIIEKVKRGDDKILDLMWDIAWSSSLKHSINVITYYHKKYKNGG